MKRITDEDIQLGNELHLHLLAGALIATSEIAEIFLTPLVDQFKQVFQHVGDPHLVETMVIDALVDYFERPQQFDPRRGNLYAYLYIKAKSDILNALKPTKLDQSIIPLAELVELDDDQTVYGVELAEDMDIEQLVTNQLSPVWSRIAGIIPDKTDQQLVHLMMSGARETQLFAQVLGIDNLPADEQARQVKQHKDRLKKVIQRHIRKEELSDD